MININKKNLYDEYDDEDMKRNNICFRKNPFINDVKENEERIMDKKDINSGNSLEKDF